jgi:phosphohistidine phosphatase SixA
MPNPATVLILRHAEKPEFGAHLSLKGRERAAALAYAIPTIADPDAIFATISTKESSRPVETVKPLADQLRMGINESFADDAYKQLAETILEDAGYSGQNIIICWHHGKIPELAVALGATDAPKHWDGAIFDRFWILDYDEDGSVTFSDEPQQLMFGDTTD